MKTIKPLILAASLILVSFQSYGQEKKDDSVIIKQGKIYEYNGAFYTRKKLSTVMYSFKDVESIRLVDQARRYNIAGNVFMITGGVVTVNGLLLYVVDKSFEDWWLDTDYKASNAGLVMAGVGAGMVVLGGMLKASGNTALRKSIERFNSVQIGKQEVRLDLVPMHDTIGLAMTWKIK